MKVAIYSGGIVSPTFIERLINGLSENNTKVVLFGRVNGNQYSFHKDVEIIKNPNGIIGVLYFIFRFIKAFVFCRNRLIKYHVYHNNWPWTSKIAWHMWQRHLPVILYLPDVFHLQWAVGTENWIFLKKIYGVKFVVSLRGAHINYSPLFSKKLVEQYKECFPHVDAFHAVSKAIANEACIYGASLNKIKIVYSGLNLEKFKFSYKNNSNKSNLIQIISVGRPHWKKGYRYALDAIKALHQKGYTINYSIVGGLEPEQWHQLNQLQLTGIVNVIERLPFNLVKDKIAASTILFLPSVEEGIANVVLEAMALGTIVVCSDCGGMKEVVSNRETGFIFPIRNVDAMVECMEEAINLSKSDYDKITINARQLVEKQHNIKSLIEGMQNLYKSL